MEQKNAKFLQRLEKAQCSTINFAVNRNDKIFYLPCEKNAMDNLFVKDISFVISAKFEIKNLFNLYRYLFGCHCFSARCQRSMNHEQDESVEHECEGKCHYHAQYDNRIFTCRVSYTLLIWLMCRCNQLACRIGV